MLEASLQLLVENKDSAFSKANALVDTESEQSPIAILHDGWRRLVDRLVDALNSAGHEPEEFKDLHDMLLIEVWISLQLDDRAERLAARKAMEERVEKFPDIFGDPLFQSLVPLLNSVGQLPYNFMGFSRREITKLRDEFIATVNKSIESAQIVSTDESKFVDQLRKKFTDLWEAFSTCHDLLRMSLAPSTWGFKSNKLDTCTLTGEVPPEATSAVTPKLVRRSSKAAMSVQAAEVKRPWKCPALVVGDKPFVRNVVDYFEVTIDGTINKSAPVSIGLCCERFPLNEAVGSMRGSMGYTSDGFFYNDGSRHITKGSPFGPGDTVGCGVCQVTGRVFFTLNGHHQSSPFGLEYVSYPCVSMTEPSQTVDANFGEYKFLYDLLELHDLDTCTLLVTGMNPRKHSRSFVVGGEEHWKSQLCERCGFICRADEDVDETGNEFFFCACGSRHDCLSRFQPPPSSGVAVELAKGGYIKVGDPPVLKLSGNMTVEARVIMRKDAFESHQGVQWIVARGGAPLLYVKDGHFVAGVGDDPAGLAQWPVSDDHCENSVHIAAVFDEDYETWKLYLDGDEVAESSEGSPGEGGWVFGGNPDNADNTFPGNLNEIRIWKVARSEDDVEEYKDSRIDNTKDEDLVGYWQLHDGAGSSVTDATAQENHSLLSKGRWVYIYEIHDGEPPVPQKWTAPSDELQREVQPTEDEKPNDVEKADKEEEAKDSGGADGANPKEPTTTSAKETPFVPPKRRPSFNALARRSSVLSNGGSWVAPGAEGESKRRMSLSRRSSIVSIASLIRRGSNASIRSNGSSSVDETRPAKLPRNRILDTIPSAGEFGTPVGSPIPVDRRQSSPLSPQRSQQWEAPTPATAVDGESDRGLDEDRDPLVVQTPQNSMKVKTHSVADVRKWDAADVTQYLHDLGLSQYSARFRDEDVCGVVLLRLTKEKLLELGVQSLGHRERIMDSIDLIKAGSDSRSSGVASSMSSGPPITPRRRPNSDRANFDEFMASRTPRPPPSRPKSANPSPSPRKALHTPTPTPRSRPRSQQDSYYMKLGEVGNCSFSPKIPRFPEEIYGAKTFYPLKERYDKEYQRWLTRGKEKKKSSSSIDPVGKKELKGLLEFVYERTGVWAPRVVDEERKILSWKEAMKNVTQQNLVRLVNDPRHKVALDLTDKQVDRFNGLGFDDQVRMLYNQGRVLDFVKRIDDYGKRKQAEKNDMGKSDYYRRKRIEELEAAREYLKVYFPEAKKVGAAVVSECLSNPMELERMKLSGREAQGLLQWQGRTEIVLQLYRLLVFKKFLDRNAEELRRRENALNDWRHRKLEMTMTGCTFSPTIHSRHHIRGGAVWRDYAVSPGSHNNCKQKHGY